MQIEGHILLKKKDSKIPHSVTEGWGNVIQSICLDVMFLRFLGSNKILFEFRRRKLQDIQAFVFITYL